MMTSTLLLLTLCAGCVNAVEAHVESTDTTENRDSGSSAQQRAVAFLSREVSQWSTKNKCFSCHNNGDAARALYRAVRLSSQVKRTALVDTNHWLAHPESWKHNRGEGPFSDQTLANIQFATALVEAINCGVVKRKPSLIRAAELVARDQQPDGSWKIGAEGTIGSPTTYGPVLATVLCRTVLVESRDQRFAKRIERAEKWLGRQRPQTVFDSAAILLAGVDNRSDEQRRHCLSVIRTGEADSGGWGPYLNSAPEPFDTAVVLLALTSIAHHGRTRRASCANKCL